MAKSFQDLSSKKQFNWTTKVSSEEEEEEVAAEDTSLKTSSNTNNTQDGKIDNIKLSPLPKSSSLNTIHEDKKEDKKLIQESVTAASTSASTKRKAVAKLKSRGYVHFAFQKDPNSQPAFLVELATPISGLVREMSSGLVRIALECDKEEEKKKSTRLIDEPLWRTYCNGKKCGFATTRECGPKELQILKAVEPISMGAGVLPGNSEE
ncbi:hypothetical protein RND71_010406 [Anisodus tanguticus]|uniref:Protein MIZU-KUSSEI 1-like n=1 Tax=Anisodus tanguticus TaxID=243964 RepID=A0AAE1VNS3_9SOLA|nr:hypothetical protein RND71_010406 [Anisodus tanguticus]